MKVDTTLGVEYKARKYVGKPLPKYPPYDESLIETEVKVLDIDRDEIISTLVKLGAKHTTTGIARIYHYEIPEDENEQKDILELIKSNKPELRQIYNILEIIKKRIEEKTKLIDKLGLLRIIVEKNKTRLVYKEPIKIDASVKKEKEYSITLKDQEEAMMFVNTIGLHLFRFIEKNRERYILDQIKFDVDTWPKLGTYLKVEAFDVIEIFRGLHRIGISPSKATGVHAEDLFKGYNINLQRLIFTEKELKILKFVRNGSPILD